MAPDTIRSEVHGSPTVDTIEIPADIAEALENLPRSPQRDWEPWMDEALRRYWKAKRKADVAKAIDMPEKRCRQRAEELGL